VEWVTGLLAAAGAARVGQKWQCPAHATTGEHSPSLSITRGRDGRLLLFCHAGCGWADILRALALPMEVLWTPPVLRPRDYARRYLRRLAFPPPRIDRGSDGAGWVAVSIDEHPYGSPPFAWKVRERNAAGTKRMRWESVNPRGERVPGLLGRREADLPLYLQSEVRMAVATGERIVLVESESSVDALVKASIYATTWPGGASSPPLERLRAELAAADVLLVPDHDDAGLACAARIRAALPNARVVLPDPGEDARDLLNRLGPARFRALINNSAGSSP
jgi:hypothetical protein